METDQNSTTPPGSPEEQETLKQGLGPRRRRFKSCRSDHFQSLAGLWRSLFSAALLAQHFHHVLLVKNGCLVQRRPAGVVLGIDLGPVSQQQFRRGLVAHSRRQV